jgi:hypothetical protein
MIDFIPVYVKAFGVYFPDGIVPQKCFFCRVNRASIPPEVISTGNNRFPVVTGTNNGQENQ